MTKFKSLQEYPHDMQDRVNNRILQDLLDSNVYCNINSLVQSIVALKMSGGSCDDIDEDLCMQLQEVPWDDEELCWEAGFDVIEHDGYWYWHDRDLKPFTKDGLKLIRAKGPAYWWRQISGDDKPRPIVSERPDTAAVALTEYWLDRLESRDYDDKDEALEACMQENRIERRYHEVYEHYVVSDFFGRQLTKAGEQVVDLGNLNVWCRTCTGQSVILDGCIHRIAFGMEILKDQDNSWEKKT